MTKSKKRGRPKGSKNKPKGLGDTIEQITEATGIKEDSQGYSRRGLWM